MHSPPSALFVTVDFNCRSEKAIDKGKRRMRHRHLDSGGFWHLLYLTPLFKAAYYPRSSRVRLRDIMSEEFIHLSIRSFLRLSAHIQMLPVLESGEETLV